MSNDQVAVRLLPEQRRLAAKYPSDMFDAFWPGEGLKMLDVLIAGSWQLHRYEAPYYWVLRKPVGPAYAYISYTEGDITFEDNPYCGGNSDEE